MLFGKKRDGDEIPSKDSGNLQGSTQQELLIIAPEGAEKSPLTPLCRSLVPDLGIRCISSQQKLSKEVLIAQGKNVKFFLVVFPSIETLHAIQDAVIELRKGKTSGYPTLIAVFQPEALRSLGSWLSARTEAESIHGLRLMVASSYDDIPPQLPSRLTPVKEPNIIRMPTSPEVECKTFKSFFAISDDLRNIVKLMKELAENNISRVYLLGAPGAGKTTLAYYYYLCRNKGNFVAVNLTAESTGDKESMKSLICGHVPGALPGAGSREGALSFAGDGVCFLDESHGVTGVVMQILMEVLDSGQFLPYGATKKRSLDCAVIFASNRSWEALREMMNLDEHARLGATILKLSDLAAREEDLIAVLAITLENFAKRCTTWKPPLGVSAGAWKEYKKCQWRGNTRTLMRVTETACVSYATSGSPTDVLTEEYILEGIDLWEPETHSTAGMYVSFRPDDKTPAEKIAGNISTPDSTARFDAQR